MAKSKTSTKKILVAVLIICFTTGCSRNSPNLQSTAQLNAPDTPVAIASTATNPPASLEPQIFTSSTPDPASPTLYFDDFRNGIEEWSSFVVDGKTSVIAREKIGANFFPEEDYFIIELTKTQLWAYSILNAIEVADVQVEVVAVNQGINRNNTTLVCRYSEDGWYEFSIENSGLYYIYHALPRFDGYVAYTVLANGGSNEIKQGFETNKYTGICQGTHLTLKINDILIRDIEVTQFDLSTGKAGVSASSFVDVPVRIKFDTFALTTPSAAD